MFPRLSPVIESQRCRERQAKEQTFIWLLAVISLNGAKEPQQRGGECLPMNGKYRRLPEIEIEIRSAEQIFEKASSSAAVHSAFDRLFLTIFGSFWEFTGIPFWPQFFGALSLMGNLCLGRSTLDSIYTAHTLNTEHLMWLEEGVCVGGFPARNAKTLHCRRRFAF